MSNCCCPDHSGSVTGTLQGRIYNPSMVRGKDGKSAYEVAVDNGYVGTEEEWLRSLRGPDGRSAYQVAVDNGFEGTEEEWLESLKGKGVSVHNLLEDRDALDAHPISAISGLQSTIDNLHETDSNLQDSVFDVSEEVKKKQDTVLTMSAQDVLDICS